MCIGSVITAIENMMVKILIAESNCLNETRDNGGMANVKDKDQQTIVYLVELRDDLVKCPVEWCCIAMSSALINDHVFKCHKGINELQGLLSKAKEIEFKGELLTKLIL